MKSSIWNIRDTIRTNEGVKELSKFVEKDGMKKLAYKINSIKGHINQEKFPPWVIIPLMYKQENHRIKQVILALKDYYLNHYHCLGEKKEDSFILDFWNAKNKRNENIIEQIRNLYDKNFLKNLENEGKEEHKLKSEINENLKIMSKEFENLKENYLKGVEDLTDKIFTAFSKELTKVLLYSELMKKLKFFTNEGQFRFDAIDVALKYFGMGINTYIKDSKKVYLKMFKVEEILLI